MQSPEIYARIKKFHRDEVDTLTAHEFPLDVQKLFVEQFLEDHDLLDFYDEHLDNWEGLKE